VLSTELALRVLSVWVAEVRLTGRKENSVAKEINCPCGQTVRGDDDDQLVVNTEEHVREKHPEMVGTKSREEILAMAHDA
jgi:predicted small metal-binding protein